MRDKRELYRFAGVKRSVHGEAAAADEMRAENRSSICKAVRSLKTKMIIFKTRRSK